MYSIDGHFEVPVPILIEGTVHSFHPLSSCYFSFSLTVSLSIQKYWFSSLTASQCAGCEHWCVSVKNKPIWMSGGGERYGGIELGSLLPPPALTHPSAEWRLWTQNPRSPSHSHTHTHQSLFSALQTVSTSWCRLASACQETHTHTHTHPREHTHTLTAGLESRDL